MNHIYLDYAASSLKHFDIYKEVISELEQSYANPSSSHSLGKLNNKKLIKAKEYIAKTINAQKENIIFTSGGTEANNMVFNHILNTYNKGEIIISNIEHSSVKECAEKLKKLGFKIIELDVDKNGKISIADLKEKINKNTILISIMLANNETGIIQPIEEISKIIDKNNILLHSDIVQAYCKINIDVKKLNLDFASVSAHKIGATNNFGFLYTKNTNITPLIIGGGQENGLRSGTSDIFSTLILKKAIDKTSNSINQTLKTKHYLITQLKKYKIDFEINGDINNSLPNIINLYFKNIQAQRLITFLDINNIYISGGAACSSGNILGSKIIKNMYDEHRAEHSVRISIGFDTTYDKIDLVVKKIYELDSRIKERGN